jgi:hypothetical protein
LLNICYFYEVELKAILGKRVVVVHWKNRQINYCEVFSNLKNFCLSYPGYNYNTLNNYLSKRKIAYETAEIRVERINVITSPKQEASAPAKRKIALIARHVRIDEADDQSRDLSYWLAKSPQERLEAVTHLIASFPGKNVRMDKSVVKKLSCKNDPLGRL